MFCDWVDVRFYEKEYEFIVWEKLKIKIPKLSKIKNKRPIFLKKVAAPFGWSFLWDFVKNHFLSFSLLIKWFDPKLYFSCILVFEFETRESHCKYNRYKKLSNYYFLTMKLTVLSFNELDLTKKIQLGLFFLYLIKKDRLGLDNFFYSNLFFILK